MTRDHNDAILAGWNDYLSIASLVGKVSWEYDGLKALCPVVKNEVLIVLFKQNWLQFLFLL